MILGARGLPDRPGALLPLPDSCPAHRPIGRQRPAPGWGESPVGQLPDQARNGAGAPHQRRPGRRSDRARRGRRGAVGARLAPDLPHRGHGQLRDGSGPLLLSRSRSARRPLALLAPRSSAAGKASYLRVFRNRNMMIISLVMMVGAAGRNEGADMAYLSGHLQLDFGYTAALDRAGHRVAHGWQHHRPDRSRPTRGSLFAPPGAAGIAVILDADDLVAVDAGC